MAVSHNRLPSRVIRTLLASLAISPVLLSGGRAYADPPAIFGWWTTENPGAPQPQAPTALPGQPSGLPNDPSPDIPSGGFEVTDIGADTSYAAIGYFTYGSTVSSVTLKLAPNANDLPNSTVEACLLTGSGSFSPDQAGPGSGGPPYSCLHSIQGIEDTSKQVVTFQVGNLVHDGYLGIAIVASGPGRLVFDAPDSSTIQAEPPSTDSSSSSLGAIGPPAPSETPSQTVPTEAASAGSVSTPTANVPTTISTAVSPALAATPNAGTPTAKTSRPTSVPSALVAVSTSSPTIGIGGAAVGAVLVVIAAIVVSTQNRRRIRMAVPLESSSTL